MRWNGCGRTGKMYEEEEERLVKKINENDSAAGAINPLEDDFVKIELDDANVIEISEEENVEISLSLTLSGQQLRFLPVSSFFLYIIMMIFILHHY